MKGERTLEFKKENLIWTREPKNYEIKEDEIRITTEPGTDLWQRTYYGFQNDNAPVLQMKTSEKYFSFVVWLKASVEYENEEYQRLGSVVTNHGYSDWATTDIDASIKTMWYRLSRRESDYCVECSGDGVNFKQMRICHLEEGAGEISFGIYACSPENSSFEAVFTEMKITECMWKAHV